MTAVDIDRYRDYYAAMDVERLMQALSLMLEYSETYTADIQQVLLAEVRSRLLAAACTEAGNCSPPVGEQAVADGQDSQREAQDVYE